MQPFLILQSELSSVRSVGDTAKELLPYFKYDIIRSNPKIFIGYSDITLLKCAIFTQAGLRTFYWPLAIPQFVEDPRPLPFTFNHFIHVPQGFSREKSFALQPLPVSHRIA